MIPTMGVCYMLQYMDKLALSQATLLNLRADLVSLPSQDLRFSVTSHQTLEC